MSKYRVYELAKEFSTTSKVIIDILNRNSISAKNHMSCVDDDAKAAVDRTFARKSGASTDNGIKAGSVINTANSNPAPQNQIKIVPQAPSKLTPQAQSNLIQTTGNRSQPNTSGKMNNINNERSPQGQFRPSNQPYNQQRNHENNQTRYQQSNQQPNQQHNRPPMQPRLQQQNQAANQQRSNNKVSHRPDQISRPAQSPQQSYNRATRPPGSFSSQPLQQGQGALNQTNQQRGPHNNTGNSMNNAGNSLDRPQNQNANRNNLPNNRNSSNKTGAARNTNFQKKPTRPPQSNYRSKQNLQSEVPSQVKTEPSKLKIVKLNPTITVKELAVKFGREVGEIIKKLMSLGVMATINQEVDIETATVLGSDFNIIVEELPPEEDPTEIQEIEDKPESLVPRPPVVTVMGHVDHGKTSVLDAIRQSNVTSHEAGGITQHIGAHQVNYHGKKIVFLDTPGHEAFTAMRARGAQVTDIAILVVAADDGVMPQTIEAINHAKSAKVPIIIAINKMDRPGANPERVKQQLTEHELVSEEWGGDTVMVEVSAHQKTGITDLLEMILLVAEMQELKANPHRTAVGTIIEAELDKGRGTVATVLVQKGTLRIGDTIIAGTAFGKVRAMVNDRGDKVKKAEPSTPVEVLGLSDVPLAGDILYVVDEKTARAVAEKRIAKKRTEDMQHSQKVSLDDLFQHIQDGKIKDLNILIKADVQGSIGALRQALEGLKNKEVRVNLVHAGVGAVNESDVMLASASNALIIAFNVSPDANARKAAETEKVDIHAYRVIYDAINDIEAALTGMLSPEFKEMVLGRAEVRKVFAVPKAIVAGSYVIEGKITNSSQVRVIRNGIVVHEGVIGALRRFKDDVKEVATSFECGISVDRYRDLKEGDIIEAFTMEALKAGN